MTPGNPDSDRPAVRAAGSGYLARPAWRNQWFLILVAVLLGALAVAVGIGSAGGLSGRNLQIALALLAAVLLVLLAVILYRHFVWTFTIHDGTIESCHGLIGRDVRSIRVQDLRNVNVRQTVFQRLFGVGNVEFSSAGGPGVEVTFYGVLDPLDVKDRVMRARGGRGLNGPLSE